MEMLAESELHLAFTFIFQEQRGYFITYTKTNSETISHAEILCGIQQYGRKKVMTRTLRKLIGTVDEE